MLLKPSTIYLTEDFGSSEFPSESGLFERLENASAETFFKVEGDEADSMTTLSPSTPTSTSQSPQNSAAANNFPPHGAFRAFSSSLPLHSRKRSMNQHSLKIVLATVKNKKIGDRLRMNYFNITEETANVADITSTVREFYKDEDLVLVPATKDLTRYEDSPATRLLSFWKNNSRKVFAVKEKEISMINTQQESPETNLQSVMVGLNRIESKIDVYADLANVCSRVFQCLICLLPAGPDIVFGGCCKQLLGCEGCVQQWFDNNDSCLHCRSEDGSERIIKLNCFAEIIEKIK